jgi:hypothetical protein
MSKINGFNPLRWDCAKSGCFNKKKRPKIEVFSCCFPGNINFGDVDGIVEINGKILMLEWKSKISDLPTGQKIMYERITNNPSYTVLIVFGDPESMNVLGYRTVKNKNLSPIKYAGLEELKGDIKKWAEKVKQS